MKRTGIPIALGGLRSSGEGAGNPKSEIRNPKSTGPLWALTLGTLLLLCGSTAWAQQGYSIRANKVLINTADHWRHWTFPKGILDVNENGQATPRFVRKHIDACRDADQFVHEIDRKQQEEFSGSWYDTDTRKYFARGGIKQAGSNPKEAVHVIDDEPHTFWEPDLNDPKESWWVEVDLGRLVSATKLVLRFAEEEEGDPFLQFKVLTSTGEKAFEISLAMDYVLAAETAKPNKDQRTFEIVLSPTEAVDEYWTENRAFQYVRIVMTDSDRDRAERITETAYEALASDWKGTIEYIWKIAGEERMVRREDYETLPVEQQGGIRYYRRERPKLETLEVWSVGDNIGLGILDRGGSMSDPNAAAVPMDAFDGSLTTRWLSAAYREAGYGAGWGLLTVDLGALFWSDTIHYILKRGLYRALGILQGYRTRVSDGSLAPDGTLIWETISPKSREVIWEEMFRLEDAFERRKVRYIEFRHLDLMEKRGDTSQPVSSAGSMAEFQIYGEGVVPEVTMTSDLMELGGSRNITTIEWDADVPPGTQVRLRTRTGDELREVKHYFDKSGKEVTEMKYNKLPSFSRGPVTTEFLPGTDWSYWSAAYNRSGDEIVSPSPRKYLIIQANLLSDDPYTAATLNSITINFRNPLAQQVMGEISPDREVIEGSPQEFAVLLEARFAPLHSGFDEILIQSPSAVEMNLVGVSLGDEADFRGGTTETFFSDEGGNFVNAQGDTLKVLNADSDSLWVRLPEVIRRGSKDWIQLRFGTTIFLNGTVFKVSVAYSKSPGSWQWVDPGEVTDWSPGRGLSVSVPMDDRIIGDVEIAPNPFTPNGDGVHDEMGFRFSVFKLNSPRKVEVVIRTLHGKRVRSLSEQRGNAAGNYLFLWDGTDDAGNRVPPGIYSAALHVNVDSESAPTQVPYVVSVVY
jgi:hypothetical protein